MKICIYSCGRFREQLEQQLGSRDCEIEFIDQLDENAGKDTSITYIVDQPDASIVEIIYKPGFVSPVLRLYADENEIMQQSIQVNIDCLFYPQQKNLVFAQLQRLGFIVNKIDDLHKQLEKTNKSMPDSTKSLLSIL